MAAFQRTLEKTYYAQGFFNVPVSHDRYVRKTDGPIKIELEGSGRTIHGRVDRSANLNATPRIHGGAELRDWFHRNFDVMDSVLVEFLSPETIRLSKPD